MYNTSLFGASAGINDDFPFSVMTTRTQHDKTMEFFGHVGKWNCGQEHFLNDFKEYLEHDSLELHYQPLVELGQGRTTAVEALLRWQHPHYGAVSPEIFIPLAEQGGAIHNLTFRILRHAQRQLQSWEADGIRIDIAVNLSMLNLHDESFPLQVEQLLKQSAVKPQRLILEITEGVIMYDPEQATSILKHLDDLGVRLALDDFGSGYSSLNHLARLPIKELKIDRALIKDIDKNSKNAVIVRSTIELAQQLGMKVVAEGVETFSVLEILMDYGCDTAQGFLFSQPVDQAEFKSWYLRRHGGRNKPTTLANNQLQPVLTV